MLAHANRVDHLGVFDASEPWGPWTTVAYYSDWGNYGNREALQYGTSTKWISADGTSVWVTYSSTGDMDSFNLVEVTLTNSTAAR